jgi:WD40 repeat protein
MVASGDGEALLWDISPTGPPELGAIAVEGQVWHAEFSDDGATMYVADQPDARGRMRAVDLAGGAVLAVADDFGQTPNSNVSPLATTSGIVAGWVGGGRHGRVVDLDTGRELTQLDPCDIPTAIDGEGRWLLVTAVPLEPGCGGPAASKILDPMSGDVLLTLPDVAGGSAIGPPGTISDGIAVYQRLDSEGGLVFRDLRSGEHLGTVEILTWTPAFSTDGRYVTVGSDVAGGFAIDVERVLAGGAASAIVLNPVVEGGFTSFPVVVGDRLVTGHAGEVLRFWRLSDGAQELALPVTSIDSTYIFPTPDGRFLYYESDGHLLRRFPLRIDDLVELAERRVQRWFRIAECERYELADDCAAFVTAGRSTRLAAFTEGSQQ